jgi:hypothetical protein
MDTNASNHKLFSNKKVIKQGKTDLISSIVGTLLMMITWLAIHSYGYYLDVEIMTL